MEKEILIGKDKFSYVSNGKYIRIIGYSHQEGVLIFTKESDGKSYFHINIPETIDGLPVLVVEPLWLNVDYRKNYRHNGYDVVKIHLPENTAFAGLGQVSTGMNSVFVPNFSEEYYPRKKQILKKDDGIYHFFAEKTGDNTCNIFAIICDNQIKKDWVWSKESEESTAVVELVVPAHIDELLVVAISKDSTRALPEKIKRIVIEEGIEIIEEKCFAGLPYITNVFVPKSVKFIGDGAFGYYEQSEYVKKVPTLWVSYCGEMPQLGKDAFVRRADKENYEEYADWGNMYAGTTTLEYEVVYQKVSS